MLGVSADVPELEGSCGSNGISSRMACVVDFCGPSDFLAIAAANDGAGHPRSTALASVTRASANWSRV